MTSVPHMVGELTYLPSLSKLYPIHLRRLPCYRASCSSWAVMSWWESLNHLLVGEWDRWYRCWQEEPSSSSSSFSFWIWMSVKGEVQIAMPTEFGKDGEERHGLMSF